MDALRSYMKEHKDAGTPVSSARLLNILDEIKSTDQNERIMDRRAYLLSQKYVENAGTINYDDTMELLRVVVPSFAATEPKQNRRLSSSANAEGSRLRMRGRAAMTDAEYDAMAERARNEMSEAIPNYAMGAGLMGSPRQSPGNRHTSYSDPEAATTPTVNRRVLQRHLRGNQDPNNDMADQEVPNNSSPIKQPVSPVLSPTRLSTLDYTTQQKIEQLMSRNADLQKQANDKGRRLELIEDQHEKRIAAMHRELDECKAELTMKKREIEKLKSNEKGYGDSIRMAEEEVERLGKQLSITSNKNQELKRKLETKTTQGNETKARLLEYQTEIGQLKQNLDANTKLQEEQSRECGELELRCQELEHQLKVSKKFEEEANMRFRENADLNETIEGLHQELNDIRGHMQNVNLEGSGAGGVGGRRTKKYNSLLDEMSQTEGGDMQEVDDISSDVDDGYQWLDRFLSQSTPEEILILKEIWNRAGYCDEDDDNTSNDNKQLEQPLLRELFNILRDSKPGQLKETIESQSKNPRLLRIVENVSGEYTKHQQQRMVGHKRSPSTLAQMWSSGQHTTMAVIVYSVVVFCLGIITASYMNGSGSSMPMNLVPTNQTMGGLVQQVLVVDDTPTHKYYAPLRKRSPRSRFGEILFYWMEALLWDDNVPVT